MSILSFWQGFILQNKKPQTWKSGLGKYKDVKLKIDSTFTGINFPIKLPTV